MPVALNQMTPKEQEKPEIQHRRVRLSPMWSSVAFKKQLAFSFSQLLWRVEVKHSWDQKFVAICDNLLRLVGMRMTFMSKVSYLTQRPGGERAKKSEEWRIFRHHSGERRGMKRDNWGLWRQGVGESGYIQYLGLLVRLTEGGWGIERAKKPEEIGVLSGWGGQ